MIIVNKIGGGYAPSRYTEQKGGRAQVNALSPLTLGKGVRGDREGVTPRGC